MVNQAVNQADHVASKVSPPKVLERLFLKESSSTFSSPDCIEKAVLPKLNWFLLFDIIGET